MRCGSPFQDLLSKEGAETHFGRDPVEALYRLFSACVPCARNVFTGVYRPLRLLHANEYVLDKAFVYGIVALSKWLGAERFRQGVYGQWPPTFPAALAAHGGAPPDKGSPHIDLEASTGDDHHPRHEGVKSAASSSSGLPHP